MYPTICLIILLSVQETPKVLGQSDKCPHVFGQAGGGCLYPSVLHGIPLSGTTYGYLLSSTSPQARQYTPPSRRSTENESPAQPFTVLHRRPGLLGGIRFAAHREETCPGLVLHRCLCPCAHTYT